MGSNGVLAGSRVARRPPEIPVPPRAAGAGSVEPRPACSWPTKHLTGEVQAPSDDRAMSAACTLAQRLAALLLRPALPAIYAYFPKCPFQLWAVERLEPQAVRIGHCLQMPANEICKVLI